VELLIYNPAKVSSEFVLQGEQIPEESEIEMMTWLNDVGQV